MESTVAAWAVQQDVLELEAEVGQTQLQLLASDMLDSSQDASEAASPDQQSPLQLAQSSIPPQEVAGAEGPSPLDVPNDSLQHDFEALSLPGDHKLTLHKSTHDGAESSSDPTAVLEQLIAVLGPSAFLHMLHVPSSHTPDDHLSPAAMQALLAEVAGLLSPAELRHVEQFCLAHTARETDQMSTFLPVSAQPTDDLCQMFCLQPEAPTRQEQLSLNSGEASGLWTGGREDPDMERNSSSRNKGSGREHEAHALRMRLKLKRSKQGLTDGSSCRGSMPARHRFQDEMDELDRLDNANNLHAQAHSYAMSLKLHGRPHDFFVQMFDMKSQTVHARWRPPKEGQETKNVPHRKGSKNQPAPPEDASMQEGRPTGSMLVVCNACAVQCSCCAMLVLMWVLSLSTPFLIHTPLRSKDPPISAVNGASPGFLGVSSSR